MDKHKEFERRVEQCLNSSVPDIELDRLYDPMGGFKNIRNICDFIGYLFPHIFYIECKAVMGRTLPYSEIRQWEDLKKKVGKKGIATVIVVWFMSDRKVIWYDLNTVDKLQGLDRGSLNQNNVGGGIIQVPSVFFTYPKMDFGTIIDYYDKRTAEYI